MLIRRRPSTEIESILGYMLEPVLIHRDNLVVI
jgi:glutamate 5-kinase